MPHHYHHLLWPHWLVLNINTSHLFPCFPSLIQPSHCHLLFLFTHSCLSIGSTCFIPFHAQGNTLAYFLHPFPCSRKYLIYRNGFIEFYLIWVLILSHSFVAINSHNKVGVVNTLLLLPHYSFLISCSWSNCYFKHLFSMSNCNYFFMFYFII